MLLCVCVCVFWSLKPRRDEGVARLGEGSVTPWRVVGLWHPRLGEPGCVRDSGSSVGSHLAALEEEKSLGVLLVSEVKQEGEGESVCSGCGGSFILFLVLGVCGFCAAIGQRDRGPA
jgi:hypothetical protein